MVDFGEWYDTTLLLFCPQIKSVFHFWEKRISRVIFFLFRQTQLNSKNDYSFEETCIGTWANGKPLYRKVIMTAVNYTASESYVTYAIPHNISNISSVCMICAWMQSVGNDTVYVLPYTHPTSGEIETFVTALNRSSISMRNKAAWGNYNFVTVIEYTKTTD